MKEFSVTLLRKLIKKILSPSMRFKLKEMAAWLREQVDRACVWRWEITWLPQQAESTFSILYVGRKVHQVSAKKILVGAKDASVITQASAKLSSQTVIVSQMPIPGALCVPEYLRAIVPLGRSVEEIMAEFDSELRRSIRKNRPYYRMKQALSDAEIEYADRELLRPYASARHGKFALQYPLETVRRVAQEYGRLDFVFKGDEVVACLLAYDYVCSGKRYWMLDVYGYPETVFSDPKRLAETNSMNNHLALEWAIENGYDYYDLALVYARPDDGLLKWKKRRGSVLSTVGLRGYSHFHIRLPRVGAAKFLWDSPLFAIERHKLTLHLGLPEGLNDDEIANRYREMGFGGLFKVYMYCDIPPEEHIIERLRSLYAQQQSPPSFEIVASK